MAIFLHGYYNDHAAGWLREAIRESNKRVGRRQSWAEAVQDPKIAKALDEMYDAQGQCSARDANGFACRHNTPHPYMDSHKNELEETWKGPDAQEGEPTDRLCPKCESPMFRRKLTCRVMMYATQTVAVCVMCHHHRRLPWSGGAYWIGEKKKIEPYDVFMLAEANNDDGPVEINGQRFCYQEMCEEQEFIEQQQHRESEIEQAKWAAEADARRASEIK